MVRRCALDGLVQTDQAVGDRVFAVQPEVDESRSHGRILRRPRFRCGPARNAPSRRPLPALALEMPAWRGSPSGAYAGCVLPVKVASYEAEPVTHPADPRAALPRAHLG